MTTLKDIIAYVLGAYPDKAHLSNARVTKILYLADWKHAITYGRQLTDIKWRFDNFGPFVWDVKDEAKRHRELFQVSQTLNDYGSNKIQLSLVGSGYKPRLEPEEIATLQHVFRQTVDMSYQTFIRFIYSTYPIVASKRYSSLNLVALAEQYQKLPT